MDANENTSLHVGSGHGWVLSREADLVLYFQRLNFAHSSNFPGHNHSSNTPRQNFPGEHSSIHLEQRSYSSDKDEGCHVTSLLSSTHCQSSPTKTTDYRRDGIDVRSVSQDFKSKFKSRGWSRVSAPSESFARPVKLLHDFSSSAEKSKSRSKIFMPTLLDHSNLVLQDTGVVASARHSSTGKQAEFEALTLGPGCPWADSVESFL